MIRLSCGGGNEITTDGGGTMPSGDFICPTCGNWMNNCLCKEYGFSKFVPIKPTIDINSLEKRVIDLETRLTELEQRLRELELLTTKG